MGDNSMEDLRMNRLFNHIDKMDKDLVSMLENYKNYSQKKTPTICVLCSDNKLRAEVDKAFTPKSDLCIAVVVTSEEVNEEEKNIAILCDAIVICTRAKNIAPKGLYDLVKYISRFDKQLFCILAGWESIERSTKMADTRAERVLAEFPFSRIVSVTNVFSESCDGFTTWDNAFDSLTSYFCEKFELLHRGQDEKIYNYILEYVEDFYTNVRTKINKEIAGLNKAERTAMTKQDYYVVRFSNLAVNVQEVVDSVRTSIEDVSYYDIVDDETNENLTDIYSRSGVEAQKFAKAFLIKEYSKRIAKLKDHSNEKFRMNIENCLEECVNEMDALLGEISKLKFLPQSLVKSLKMACEEKKDLEKILDRYESSATTLIDAILNRVPAKVGEYRYEMGYSIEVIDTGKDLLGIAKNTIKDLMAENEKDDDKQRKEVFYKAVLNNAGIKIEKTKTTDGSIDEMSRERIEKVNDDENDESLMLDRFQSDIEQLIFFSRNACGEMAQDSARIIKQDLEEFAEGVLKLYFGAIIKEIECMQTEMSKICEEYYLE